MNTHKMVADFWTPQNTDAKWPDWKNYMMEFDSHLLEDASFLRLKNLQLAQALARLDPRCPEWSENHLHRT